VIPALVVVGVLLLFLLIWVVVIYNTLVGLKNHIREAWADIDTELKRRYDLIPNLVETVKGYAAHERETLEKVIEMRRRCMDNRAGVAEQAADERDLVGSLAKVIALAEAYPDLKADEHYAKLHQELVNTEDRIQAARRFYNGNVRDYRNTVEKFPSSLVAGMFGFTLEEYFKVDPSVREVPSAEF